MRISKTIAAIVLTALGAWSCGNSSVSSPNGSDVPAHASAPASVGGKIVGFRICRRISDRATLERENSSRYENLPTGFNTYRDGRMLNNKIQHGWITDRYYRIQRKADGGKCCSNSASCKRRKFCERSVLSRPESRNNGTNFGTLF